MLSLPSGRINWRNGQWSPFGFETQECGQHSLRECYQAKWPVEPVRDFILFLLSMDHSHKQFRCFSCVTPTCEEQEVFAIRRISGENGSVEKCHCGDGHAGQ